MIEPKPTGFVRQKMSVQTAPPGSPRAVRQLAIEARRAFYNATRELDGIIRQGGEPAAVEAALKPYIAAAEMVLAVSLNDAK